METIGGDDDHLELPSLSGLSYLIGSPSDNSKSQVLVPGTPTPPSTPTTPKSQTITDLAPTHPTEIPPTQRVLFHTESPEKAAHHAGNPSTAEKTAATAANDGDVEKLHAPPAKSRHVSNENKMVKELHEQSEKLQSTPVQARYVDRSITQFEEIEFYLNLSKGTRKYADIVLRPGTAETNKSGLHIIIKFCIELVLSNTETNNLF